MTFFDKADLIEKMDEDLQKKLAMVKGYDITFFDTNYLPLSCTTQSEIAVPLKC